MISQLSKMATIEDKLLTIAPYNSILTTYDALQCHWAMFNTFVKFDAKYIYYNYVDCEFTKCLRRERLFTPREDPFFRLTPKEIKDKYRFYPHTIMDICQLVQKELERPTKRSNPLTVQQVVCVSLYILAHGKY